MARYIDIEKLEKNIRNYADKKCYNGETELANGILKSLSIIKEQPTADVKEVVRGKWKIEKKSKFNYDKCSACGFNKPSFLEFRKYDFCPYCGADMRGAKANAKPISETKRLLNLAIEHLQGKCTCCQNYETCKDKRGSHKYCWKWFYQQEYDEVRRKYVKY